MCVTVVVVVHAPLIQLYNCSSSVWLTACTGIQLMSSALFRHEVSYIFVQSKLLTALLLIGTLYML